MPLRGAQCASSRTRAVGGVLAVGSLAQRLGGGLATGPVLSDGPLPWPKNWLDQVNRSLTEKELDSLRQCVERGQPYGSEAWGKRAAGKPGLASTLRPRGRPKKAEKKGS